MENQVNVNIFAMQTHAPKKNNNALPLSSSTSSWKSVSSWVFKSEYLWIADDIIINPTQNHMLAIAKHKNTLALPTRNDNNLYIISIERFIMMVIVMKE